LDGKSWPFANLQVKVTGVLAERFSVNCSKVDLASVLLSDRL
jgi:hypothetical protein